ncbi:MAG: hypothetical protein LBQ88_22670, partial [Treponema sp.]|nr:hypothetical protein [Treponema sp.]
MRLILVYLTEGKSFAGTSVIIKVGGGFTLNKNAVYKRIRNSADWLERLCVHLLRQGGTPMATGEGCVPDRWQRGGIWGSEENIQHAALLPSSRGHFVSDCTCGFFAQCAFGTPSCKKSRSMGMLYSSS